MNAVQKLRQMAGELRSPKGPMQLISSWELVKGLLSRMPADPAEVKRVCDAKDIEGYEAVVTKLEALDAQQRGGKPAPGKPNGTAGNNAPAPAPPVTPEMSHKMEAAMKAFRKRLKLTRLGEESKLGGRQLTSGRKSQVDAILPPHEFADDVWKALVASGKLLNAGQGFYQLANDSGGSNAHDEILT
jgi:hypothetical protein